MSGTGQAQAQQADARKLASRLYSYVQGDSEMMRVVRVPTPEQEQLRAESRQHDQLVATRKALAAQGGALVLSQGYGMMKGLGGGQWLTVNGRRFCPSGFGQSWKCGKAI